MLEVLAFCDQKMAFKTSYNKDENANFRSEEIRTMKLSGRLFFENTRKTFRSNLIVVLVLESKGLKDSKLKGPGGSTGACCDLWVMEQLMVD